MKIPEKVKVGGIIYDVSMVDHPLCVDRKEVAGKIDFNDALIQVRSDVQEKQQQERTFLHELFHAMVRECGLDFEDKDELFTEGLARVLHGVIVDNPELFKEG